MFSLFYIPKRLDFYYGFEKHYRGEEKEGF